MTENRKISRILQFIIRLRGPLGCDKVEAAGQYGVTVRTIERHIRLLREIGFIIEQTGNRYRIVNSSQAKFHHEELIAFSIEEAMLLRDSLLTSKLAGPMQHQLLDKLYALTDMDELADTMTNLQRSRTIAEIRKAIQQKRQVWLVDYESAHSDSKRSRLIEPQRFQDYFRYLLAFEPDSMQNKVFKTDRIGEVRATSRKWRHSHQHQRLGMDAFGLTGTQPLKVRLQLSRRARQLLCEEYPDASDSIQSKGDKHLFDGAVYGFQGIGRFVMGLLDEVEVLEPQELIDYINEKVKKYCQ